MRDNTYLDCQSEKDSWDSATSADVYLANRDQSITVFGTFILQLRVFRFLAYISIQSLLKHVDSL